MCVVEEQAAEVDAGMQNRGMRNELLKYLRIPRLQRITAAMSKATSGANQLCVIEEQGAGEDAGLQNRGMRNELYMYLRIPTLQRFSDAMSEAASGADCRLYSRMPMVVSASTPSDLISLLPDTLRCVRRRLKHHIRPREMQMTLTALTCR